MRDRRPPRTARRAAPTAVIAAAAALFVAMLAATPVAGHSDEGTMTLVAADQVAADALRLEVGIVYTDDGHLAEDATITAVLDAPDHPTVGPVTLPQISGGRYGADVVGVAPGAWAVTISSVDPTAEMTTSVEVAEGFTPAPDTPATAAGEQAGIVPQEPPPPVPADEDDDSFPWVIVIALVVIALLIVASATFLRRGARTRAGRDERS